MVLFAEGLDAVESVGDSTTTSAAGTQVVDMVPVTSLPEGGVALTSILMPPPTQTVVQNLPPGCPNWAARLRDCEVSRLCACVKLFFQHCADSRMKACLRSLSRLCQLGSRNCFRQKEGNCAKSIYGLST